MFGSSLSCSYVFRVCLSGGFCCFQVLHAAATLAQEFIADDERVAPRALLDTAVGLHHVMLSLQGLQGSAVQAIIGKV